MLEDRKQDLRTLAYDPAHPIDIIFNAVDDFADFANLGLQPLSNLQKISKAYVIINKTRTYKTDLTAWNCRPDIEKTWPNFFKEHFRRAHIEFRETTNVTLEESDLHRNNAQLVQHVVDGMTQAMASDTTADTNAVRFQEMSNSATRSTEAQQQLQTQLQQMQQAMSLLQVQVVANQSYPPQAQQGVPPQQYTPFHNAG